MASKIRQKKQDQPRVASATADRGLTGATADAVSVPPVKKSLRAGRYVRLTLTVRPDQLERIRNEIPSAWAAELEEMTGWPVTVSTLEMGRWLLDVGLAAWDDGERPPVPALKQRG